MKKIDNRTTAVINAGAVDYACTPPEAEVKDRDRLTVHYIPHCYGNSISVKQGSVKMQFTRAEFENVLDAMLDIYNNELDHDDEQ